MPLTKPYGKWGSNITAEAIGSNITFSDVLVDPIKKVVYHIEQNPENGSSALVGTLTGKNVLPPGYNASDFVNEYGGAPAIVRDGIVYFSNQADNSVYALDLNASTPTPRRITPANPALRYANFVVHPTETHLLVAIREDHTNDPDGNKSQNVVYTLSIIDTKNATVEVLTHGADFYASPVFNPSGSKIAWQEWYLPDMPWEGGIIYVADAVVSDGTIYVTNHVQVAGKRQAVSATFPSWVNDSILLYTSDEDNGFQNPFKFDTHTQKSTPVLGRPLDKDFAEPAWYLGLYPYAILGDGRYAAFTAFENGKNILFTVDLAGSSTPVQIRNFDFAVAEHLRPLGDNTFVFTGSGATSPGGVFQGTIRHPSATNVGLFTALKTTGEHPEWEEYIATPVPRALPVGNYNIYVTYYLPRNPDFVAPSGEKPPCIIGVHGGPTALEPQALNWTKTFYTSRGFAWLDVNYRGSSGYGRQYIELLNGQWGRFDIDDCKEAHKILAAEGILDAKRVAIRGGSAGGYTTLSSLTFAPEPGYYKAACSAYGGIADPTLLAKVTEKFESQYVYTLFGSLPDGGAWDDRSPIDNIVNKLTGKTNFSVPLLVLHGKEDPVVPIAVIEDFLKKAASFAPTVPVEHKFYDGERHHFVHKEDIIDALEREHAWYVQHLL